MSSPTEREPAAFDILALVTSAESGDALAAVISELPDALPVPLLIGQHLDAPHALERVIASIDFVGEFRDRQIRGPGSH